MVKTPHFHHGGIGSVPGGGTKILMLGSMATKLKKKKTDNRDKIMGKEEQC